MKIIPSNDPARMARVLNDKQRTIGVDRAALDAQLAEAAQKRAAEAEQERLHSKMLTQQVAIQHDIANSAAQAQHQQQRNTMQHNMQLADMHYQHNLHQQRLAAAAAQQHVHTAMHSNFLTETPTKSILGPHRIRPDHYKGMSVEEQKAVRNTQHAQVEAHIAAQQQQQAEQRSWAAREAAVLAQRDTLEQQAAAQRRESIHAYSAFLRGQAQHDAQKFEHLQRVFAPSGFAQYFSANFQTSHR